MVDAGDRDIAQYSVTAAGLVLKVPETIPAGANPNQIVVAPDGNHVYVTDSADSEIWQFGGGDGPGTLAPQSPPGANIAPDEPYGIAIGPPQIGFNCADVILACIVHIHPLPFPLPVGRGGPPILIRATVVRAAPLGILIQRITRNQLLPVGRVPFGLRNTGRVRIRWNLRVNGHRLRAGHYLITLRMFDRQGNLIAVATPARITVPR